MKKNPEYDFIIVGAGIAGSVLAIQLHKAGKKILLTDEPSLSSCSRIAGGIYNPVVFKRLTLSWRTTDVFPAIEKFYSEAENLLGTKFLHREKMIKLFNDFHEQNEWSRRSGEAVYSDYISDEVHTWTKENKNLGNEFGSGTVNQSGWVDTRELTKSIKQFFKNRNEFRELIFDYSKLKTSSSEIQYEDIVAGGIIFCEGHKISENPFFNYIPLKPTKGEVLIVEIPGLNLPTVLKKDIYIIPLGNDEYKLGATYTWDELNEKTTEEAKNEMLAGLNKMIKLPFKVKHQFAAIRPTVKDRRPVMGAHPDHKNVFVFNGMGTKGISLAPHFSSLLVKSIEGEEVYINDVSINRFKSEFQLSRIDK